MLTVESVVDTATINAEPDHHHAAGRHEQSRNPEGRVRGQDGGVAQAQRAAGEPGDERVKERDRGHLAQAGRHGAAIPRDEEESDRVADDQPASGSCRDRPGQQRPRLAHPDSVHGRRPFRRADAAHGADLSREEPAGAAGNSGGL